MNINNIPIKQDVNPVVDPRTQVSAEEFNCIVETVRANNANRASTCERMGYVILNPDKAFADQVMRENTIYEIRDGFDLGGKSKEIPADCVLKFEGGKLSNGTIDFNNCTIIADTKVFDNVFIQGLSRVYVNWFINNNDITSLFGYINNATEPVYIYFDAKSYTCTSGIVLPPKVYLIGEGEQKNRTSIAFCAREKDSALITYTWKCGIDNIDIIVRNSEFEDAAILLSNKNYQDYEDSTHAHPGWVLKNTDIITTHRADGNYKGTAIKIDISNGTESNIFEKRAFSYSRRDFSNIKIQYFKFGIDIHIHQEELLGDIDKKVWSNSVLFDNLEVWANDAGIRFITNGVDGDTGNYCVNNYMFQAIHANGSDMYGSCAFATNNAKGFALLNLIVWDVAKGPLKSVPNPYTSEDGTGGEIIISSTKEYRLNTEQNNNFKIISSASYSPSMFFRSVDYDSSTGRGEVKMFAEDNTFKVSMVPFDKTSIDWKVTSNYYCNSSQWATDSSGNKFYENIAKKEPYIIPDVGPQVAQYSMLYNATTGKYSLGNLISIPLVNSEVGVFSGHLPYGLYILRSRADFETPLSKRSTYSIPFQFEDLYEYNVDHKVLGCGVLSLGYSSNSIGGRFCNILGHQIHNNGGYIVVQAGDEDVSYFSVAFMLIMLNNDGTPCLRHIKAVAFGAPQLIRQQAGNTLLTYESSGQVAPTLGMCQFLNTEDKPYWYGKNGWVDATGTPHGVTRTGTWSQRPNADGSFLENGFQYFLLESEPDEDPEGNPIESITGNGKPIWWIQESHKWVDATGATVAG